MTNVIDKLTLSKVKTPVLETFELKAEDSGEILHRFRPIEGAYLDTSSDKGCIGDQLFRDRDGSVHSYTQVQQTIRNLKRYRVDCAVIPTQQYLGLEEESMERPERVLDLIQKMSVTVKRQAKAKPGAEDCMKMRKALNKITELLDEYQSYVD